MAEAASAPPSIHAADVAPPPFMMYASLRLVKISVPTSAKAPAFNPKDGGDADSWAFTPASWSIITSDKG
jgi:hypothetical protein